MNCKQANEMSIVGFLQNRGTSPVKVTYSSFWICSPFRNEKTASFKIDRSKNVWFDYGIGKGGRMIDLICQMYRVDVPGALLILSGASGANIPFSFSDQQEDYQNTKTEITHIQPIQNRALIQYLTSRNINPELASIYCKEVYYKTANHEKQYFSIAFENDSHGFELRNKYFKGSTTPKDIKTIPGKNSFAVNVLEGFTDFLSLLTYFKTDQANCDTVVLNGLGFVEKFILLLPGYSKINLYLDNDPAGREAANRIQSVRPDAVNRSQIIYPKYKDFNNFLTNTK